MNTLPSLTVENYVKAIYQICVQQGGEPAATGQLAAALGVSPGTVTSMLKTLSESNLAEYTPHHGAKLTSSGDALALRVVRRHRLIELFLVRTLDLTWDEVHDEAEHMEHAVSDLLVDRIDSYLGFPDTDPHGDPIPRADGSVQSHPSRSLASCNEGERFRLIRVLDQSPEFLRYLTAAEIFPGTQGRVVANRTEAGLLSVEVAGQVTSLGRDVAEKLLVAET
ncbi:MAG TPA: metal-dependent transcriptional regulator [Pirellulales bacterium]|jgi:DtxR family Mn-dependent transcriptional regulator